MCDDENVKQKLSLEIRRTGGTGARKGGGGGGDVGVVDTNQHKIYTPMAYQASAWLPRAPSPRSNLCRSMLCYNTDVWHRLYFAREESGLRLHIMVW